MPNILKSPKSRARLGYHGHDLSRRVLFTSSCGQLLPVLHDILSIGESVRINETLFTRTQPLKTAAFVRLTEHIYYFFVPMRHLNGYFDNAYAMVNDDMDTRHYLSKTSPLVNGSNLALPQKDASCVTLKDLTRGALGYGTSLDTDSNTNWSLFVNKTAESGRYPVYLSTNYHGGSISKFLDQYEIPKHWNAIRLLDLLDYGARNYSSMRENCPLDKTSVEGLFNLNVNLYSLAAYQKIFYDYFRLSKFTVNSPYSYNFNQAVYSGDPSFIVKQDFKYMVHPDYHGLLELHYHPMKKDFFSNIETTPLADLSGSGFNMYNSGQAAADNSLNSLVLSTYGVQMQDISNTLTQMSNSNVIGTATETIAQGQSPSAQQLRLMFAYDRLLANIQRGGRHYDTQMATRIGVKVPQGISEEVYYLGSHSSPLRIGEVVATAAGSADSDNNSVLGEIAGRGVGVSKKNNDIKFTAPCHGILMAIYSAVPDVEYRDTGIDRRNLYTSINDYPQPEFDNLGMQPLYYIQSNAHLGQYNDTNKNNNVNLIFGWQYRYSELKLSYDVIHGAFNYGLIDWSAGMFFGENFRLGGSLTSPQSIQHAFYVSPGFLDRIMGVPFIPPQITITQGSGISHNAPTILMGYARNNTDVTSSENDFIPFNDMSDFFTDVVYSRDPLLHSIDFKYYKSSWLSTYGLPSL